MRRLTIRDFQVLSDSQRSLAGYNLGAGSWDTEVGVLASAVADEFLIQAAAAGVPLESLDVVFTSRPDDPATPPADRPRVSYPRHLRYTAYIVSPATDRQLEELRRTVETVSPVLNLVSQRQDIAHGTVVHTPSPATPNPDDIRTGADRFQIIHDSSRALPGYDLGPTAEEHQLGVMATCLTHIFEIQAALRQVPLDALEVRVEGTLTPRIGPGVKDPPRYRSVRYSVHIASPASTQAIDELCQAVEAVCPIYNLLKDAQPIDGRIVRERYREARS